MINQLFSDTLIQTLATAGIRHIVIAPGSRSAPLTLAAAKNSTLQTTVHWDERGVGFYALGCALATERPVAIITTSGTAVANLLPAVVEAFQSCVPLILLTADRPLRLQGTGANQTINQQGIFSHFVDHFVQLEATDSLEKVQTCLQALRRPVQFNCGFDEPLI